MSGKVKKYKIVCGEGEHRTYTCCIAELIMLNKYGNQPDFFWRSPPKHAEYIKLIKLAGKLAKEFTKDRLAFFIYKNQDYKFDGDIGLVIYNLRNFKLTSSAFTLEDLVQVYKNKYRPANIEKIEIKIKEIKVIKQQSTLDFLGDI
jgi:hypothetical protein